MMTEGRGIDEELEMMSLWYEQEELEADLAGYRALDAFSAALRERDPETIPLGLVGVISQLTETISREGNERFRLRINTHMLDAEGFVELSKKRFGQEDPSWVPTKVEITFFRTKP